MEGGTGRLIFWTSKAHTVLLELYRSVMTKLELLNTTKLSVRKLAVVLILTYGHESLIRPI